MNQPEPPLSPSPLERQAIWLDGYRPDLRMAEQGSVVSVGDGIAWIDGLPSAAMDEVLLLEDGSQALVFDLNQGLLGAILLHDTVGLTAGSTVRRAGRPLSTPVGDSLLGRVVDPLGLPLDGLPPPAITASNGWKGRPPPSSAAISCISRCTPASRSSTPWCPSARASASSSSATRVWAAVRWRLTRSSTNAAKTCIASMC